MKLPSHCGFLQMIRYNFGAWSPCFHFSLSFFLILPDFDIPQFRVLISDLCFGKLCLGVWAEVLGFQETEPSYQPASPSEAPFCTVRSDSSSFATLYGGIVTRRQKIAQAEKTLMGKEIASTCTVWF